MQAMGYTVRSGQEHYPGAQIHLHWWEILTFIEPMARSLELPRSQLRDCRPIGVWEDLGLSAAPASAPRLVRGSGGYDVEAHRLGPKGFQQEREGPGDPSDPGIKDYGL